MKLGKVAKQAFRGWMAVTVVAVGLLVNTGNAEEVLDKVVAVVEDGVVLSSELDSRTYTIIARLNAQKTPLPPPDVIRQRVLDQLILEQIQVQMAEKVGLRITDSELTETMNNIAARNGFSLDQFAEELKKEGVTLPEAREQIRTEMLTGRLQQKMVSGRVRVSESDVKNFLASAAGRKSTSTEYLLGHILVAFSSGATAEQRAEKRREVEDILKTIRNGGDFRQMAVARSDGRNALEGGVIGWRKDSDLPSLAADVVPKLAVNEVSEPIETSSGYHLVTVLDKKGGKSQIITQYKTRHILIKPSEVRTLEEARLKLVGIQKRIRNGEDFGVVAKAESEDTITGAAGGDVGWVSPGDMVPPFEEVMFSSPVGEVSAPFQTQFGWHILQVLETRKEDMGEKIQARNAREILQRKEYELELQKWMREIREEAYVEVKKA